MKNYDCIFIHPTTHIKASPSATNDSITYIIMPMGTIALADLLDREGYETVIIHTGIEQISNRNFRIENIIKKYDVSVVGIDLHWYPHSYDAIRIADIVKKFSRAFVVLGGFTSSFFAREILSHFKSIDAVICGDAELPLLKLLKHRSSAKFEEVPNLTYRYGESIKISKKKYIANSSDLDRLSFSNFTLLSNFDKYRKITSQMGDLDPSAEKAKLKTHGWLCLGRGCSANCSYCGGGKNAFEILTGRSAPIFHSKEKVVETLARFEEMKISCVYMDFDPYPTKHEFYHTLFDMIRQEKIDISAQFSSWSLCDKRLLRDFKRTFNPLYSTISLSPESGSEYIRKINKGFYYSNKELFSWLNIAKHEMIPLQIYFTSGLSGERYKHFEDTIKLGKKILEEYPVVSISCNSIELEPASPRFLFPKKYGISLKFKSFTDFYNVYKELAEGLSTSSRLGYRTDYLSESQIIKLSERFKKIMSLTYNKKIKKLYFGN